MADTDWSEEVALLLSFFGVVSQLCMLQDVRGNFCVQKTSQLAYFFVFSPSHPKRTENRDAITKPLQQRGEFCGSINVIAAVMKCVLIYCWCVESYPTDKFLGERAEFSIFGCVA